jgi:purine-binding chemotaxis protein CheW
LKRDSYARQAPISGRDRSTGLYIGLGAIEERMLIMVDIERLMSSAEMGLLEKMTA